MGRNNHKKFTAVLFGLLVFSIAGGAMAGCRAKQEGFRSASVMPTYPESIDRDKDWDKWLENLEQNEVDPAFTTSQSEFAYSTARELLASRNESMVYSPVSLYYALSLAASGTDGDTAEELYRFLRITDCENAAEKVAENAAKLYRSLYSDSSVSRMRIATSLWVDRGLELKEDFKKEAAEQLYASIHPVDFSDNRTGAMMGKWVMENTKGSIVPEIQTGPQQIMKIMNTIYFYDQWIDKFQSSKTEKGDFYLEDGSITETEYMNAAYGSYGFRRGDGFTSSSLGLKENGAMTFILPDEGMSVDSFLTSPERLKEVLEGGDAHMGQVVFQVPKFTTDSRCDVKTMMENLGIKEIFEKGDFSRMTDSSDLFISSITQDGHIAVNEKGVEASSFTNMDYAGAAIPDGRADMILDRPFLYGIRHSGVWLFIGVCDNPAG